MSLSAGTRLGVYEILTLIGSGGMGDVYRARDTKLGRDVAIKVLPDALAADPVRIARFEQEARTLAALNHPHIAHIHGVEESAGVLALVMELADGLTLAERIALGPIPIDEAMPIALQIAEALEAAHEQGIIHRDLKPANIKLRADGIVKVLDFGLAKALDPASAQDAARLADSPTVISPAVTRVGVILGTAAYMSPEQTKGRVLDKRTDVWAFGCVLYEMLTGSRTFRGDDVQDVLAAILTQGPDWRKLPGDTPTVVARLLRRCLERDLVKRLRDIGDARLEIADAIALPASSNAELPPRAPSRQLNMWQAGAAGVVIGGAIAAFLFTAGRRVPAASPVTAQRFSMTFPASASLSRTLRHFALSPDGKAIVYFGESNLLYVRALDEEQPRGLPGTEGAWNPFFSPDGEWIGYFDAGRVGGAFLVRPGQLKKVSVRGGAPVVIADAVALGACWDRDDTIVFSRQTDHGIALFTIAASGGAPKQITTPAAPNDRIRVGWPTRMRDSDTLLFSETDQPTFDDGRIIALSLRTGERRVVLEKGYAGYYDDAGHLVYLLDGSVMAIRFDPDRLRALGAPVQVIAGVQTDHVSGWPGMSVAANGFLVYDSAPGNTERVLEWVTRDRTSAPVVNDRGPYSYPRLSPDGRRLAVGVGLDIWVLDLVRGTRVRIAAADRGTSPPPPISAWTADGRRLAISRRNAPEGQLDIVDPDDLEHPTVLVRRPFLVQLGSWSKAGTLAFFQMPGGGSERDVWTLDPGTTEPRPFLASRFNERGATFSPDGGWLAYAADPTGRDEIYVRAYPGPGSQIQISTDGGVEPVWSRDAREIFYRERDRMMAVSFDSAPPAAPGRPRVLFEQPYASSGLGVANYDVATDGRFVMIRPVNIARDNLLNVVLNWSEDIKRLVPPK